jgi:large subunit ribosomal protein L22
MRPAPQGRGYRVRKRSNHVTVIVDDANAVKVQPKQLKAEAAPLEAPVTEVPVAEAKTKKAAPKKAAAKKETKKS